MIAATITAADWAAQIFPVGAVVKLPKDRGMIGLSYAEVQDVTDLFCQIRARLAELIEGESSDIRTRTREQAMADEIAALKVRLAACRASLALANEQVRLLRDAP